MCCSECCFYADNNRYSFSTIGRNNNSANLFSADRKRCVERSASHRVVELNQSARRSNYNRLGKHYNHIRSFI